MNSAAVPKVVVIGAGPAGLAAAVQLLRQGIEPLVFEAAAPGGLLCNADWVENYPGFPGGITGPLLVKRFVEQALRTGIRITAEEVLRLTWAGRAFEVKTSRSGYQADFAVVASGTKPKRLGRPPLTVGAADGVFYEIAPIWNVRNKRIAVIGAGDAAFDYALHLSRHNQVLILNRGREVRCLPLLRERSSTRKGIRYFEAAVVRAIDRSPGGRFRIEAGIRPDRDEAFLVDFVIAAIGRTPRTDFLGRGGPLPAAALEKKGRLHFAGDVRNGRERQTAIAVGDGLRAAMRIGRIVQERRP